MRSAPACQVARAADALGEVETLIKSLITLAAVIGVDETSVNVAGTKQWLHVACTEELTAYHLRPSRGRAAVAEFDMLPRYSGTVVRDALAVYDAYPATHALCGAIRRPSGQCRHAARSPIWPGWPQRPQRKD